MTNKSLETLFQIVAVILVGVAAFFLLRGNYDGVFAASVLGSVSYFLSYRYQIRQRLDERDQEFVGNERFDDQLQDGKEFQSVDELENEFERSE